MFCIRNSSHGAANVKELSFLQLDSKYEVFLKDCWSLQAVDKVSNSPPYPPPLKKKTKHRNRKYECWTLSRGGCADRKSRPQNPGVAGGVRTSLALYTVGALEMPRRRTSAVCRSTGQQVGTKGARVNLNWGTFQPTWKEELTTLKPKCYSTVL